MPSLKVLALSCSLKRTPAESSTDKLTKQVLELLEQQDASSELVRVADYNIVPGVAIDLGDSDDWPTLRHKMLEADIFILATPIWVGHPSSFAQRVVERLDAELGETDGQGRMATYGKTAGVVVVGNEDGAHKTIGDLFQALSLVGFTIPAGASSYWNGEAMHKVDYKDLSKTPEQVAATNQAMAANLIHTAKLLKASQYPAVS